MIIIENKRFGEIYYYFVYDYSNKDDLNLNNLLVSGVKVFVYVGQLLVKIYYIFKNKIGNVWNLFKINENGEIIDINMVIFKIIQDVGINYGDNDVEEEVYVLNENKKRVLQLNRKGDLVY